MDEQQIVLVAPFEPVETDVPCLSCGRQIVAKNETALELLNSYRRGYCDGCRSKAIRPAVRQGG